MGYNHEIQRTLVQSLRRIDNNAEIALRGRPWKAQDWEGILHPKPANTSLLAKFVEGDVDDGRRFIQQMADGSYKWTYSDMDIAGLSIGGKGVGFEEVDEFKNIFNKLYTSGKTNPELHKLIQHGALANADASVWGHLLDERGWEGVRKMLYEPVYIFDVNGFKDVMPFYKYLGKYYGP